MRETDAATARLERLLAPLTNYERLRPLQPRWSLAGMAGILARGEARVPAGTRLQVGGSKGKGTTTLYLEALARGAGLTTGAYLSPHVETLLERVQLDGRDATEAELLEGLAPVLAGERARSGELTFFEAMTAAAANLFAARDVALSVFEVGLGGRLDSTTAIPVDGSIVTTVELEHQELLGPTVAAIAGEKAFVIRPGRPAFTGAGGDALAVLERRAREVGAELTVLGRELAVQDLADRAGTFTGTLRLGGERARFALAGAARFELPALALAWAALRRLLPGLALPLDPVPRPAPPGRFETRQAPDGGVLILDGAHTEESLRAVAAELARRWPGQRAALLFASARNKRWREGLSALAPLVDRAWVTALSGTVSEDPAAIRAHLAALGVSAEVVPDAAAGLAALLHAGGVRLVAGSFYLVGAVRAALNRSQPR
jgi:dihydrofolate synthase/folylpolyglutamate synthase